MRDKIVIGLPAYNEEKSIYPLLYKFSIVADKLDEFEMLFLLADDASTDETINEFIRSCQLLSLPYKVLPSANNFGLGMGLRKIFSEFCSLCNNEPLIKYLLIMDADNTHQPEQLIQMVSSVDGMNNIVVASRYTSGSIISGLTTLRRGLSKVAGWYLHLWYRNANTFDFTCSYRLYGKSLVQELQVQTDGKFVSSFGFDCMPEILIRSLRLGASIVEIPLILKYDEKMSASKMRFISNSLKILLLPQRLRSRS